MFHALHFSNRIQESSPGPLREILAGGTKIVFGPPRLQRLARFAIFTPT